LRVEELDDAAGLRADLRNAAPHRAGAYDAHGAESWCHATIIL
jgi:hypothetical protein